MTQSHTPTLDAVPTRLWIDGIWAESATGRRFLVHNPATGEVLAEVADAERADGVAALQAADRAQREFARLSPRARADMLMRTFDLLRDRAEDLAILMTAEMGKPLTESRAEVTYAAEFFRHFAEEAVRVSGDYRVSPAGTSRTVVLRQPVGPSLLITPWNFPLAMGARKVAPALAAGCTCVVKPAAETPLSTLALVDILHEAGVPRGAVNVVTTTRAGDMTRAQVETGAARKLSFTGSTAVGRHLLELCSRHVMRTSMELGGNAPLLVFPDADIDAALEGAMAAKMRNSGEACTAANRFYVHTDIADMFTARLAERMERLRVGPGDQEVDVGPMITEGARQKIHHLVRDASERGARVVTGGEPFERPGYFYRPTVISDVPESARMRHEEIFGPVAPVSVFGSEQQAVDLANDTEYGLVAYVFTQDLDRAVRVAEALDVGMVGLNRGVVSDPSAPFGGIKASGLGREGGREGIEEFLEVKYLSLADPGPLRAEEKESTP